MDSRLERFSWLALLVSALGVLVTSACYALSPDVLALPIPLSRVPEAAAVASGAGRLLAFGGAVGVPADMVFAAAAFAFARHAKGLAAFGWQLGGVSAAVFTVVDAMAARCLAPGAAFPLAKTLFDMLFIAGTFSFGVSTLLVFWEQRRSALGKALLVAGGWGLVSSLLALAGANLGPGLGIAIGLGVALWAAHAARSVATMPGWKTSSS